MFLEAQKIKKMQNKKSLAKKNKRQKNPHKNFQNPFCKLKESKCHTPFLKPQTLQIPQTPPQTTSQMPTAF